MLSRLTAALAFLALSVGIASAQTTSRVATFQDWSVYAGTGNEGRVCYAASQPTQMAPQGVNRDPAFFMVSNWPGRAVTNEAYLKMGYPLEPNSTVTVTIDNDETFTFFIGADDAWISEAALEQQLIEAMRGGVTMVITGRSTRGTDTSDTYSLRGITAALARVASECGQ